MNPLPFLTQLAQQEITLQVVGGENLKVIAPPGKLTASLRQEIIARKAGLIQYLNAHPAGMGSFTWSPVEEQEYYDLSHSQKRLWILDQMHEQMVAYIIPSAYQIDGYLEVNALEQAIGEVIQRHESLRTNFVFCNGGPRQRVRTWDRINWRLPFCELEADCQFEAEAVEWTEQLMGQPFDLQKDLLIKVQLLRAHPQKHFLLFAVHHIVMDGWSAEIFKKQVSSLYYHFLTQPSRPYTGLAAQYRDYAAWERKLLKSAAGERYRRYWLEKLSGKLPASAIPTYQPRPSIQTFKGKQWGGHLSVEDTAALQRLSIVGNATLFMLLITIVKVILAKYTGNKDVILGTDSAGRVLRESEEGIGMYLDALVLRTVFTGEESFMEALQKVKDTIVEAFDHQKYPFNKIVEDLGRGNDLSKTPIFDVLVMMNNQQDRFLEAGSGLEGELPGSLEVNLLEIPTKTTKCDLEVNFVVHQERLWVNFNFNPDLYLLHQIQQIGVLFKKIVVEIIHQPHCSVFQFISSVTEEKNRLPMPRPWFKQGVPAENMKDWFEQQASDHPHRVALYYADQSFTYGQLNKVGNQLAYRLIEKWGVRPGDIIGLWLDRSETMIVSILGVMKAGGVYLPLEKSLPPKRLEKILLDSCASVLLADTDGKRALGLLPLEILDIQSELAVSLTASEENLITVHTPDDYLYIMYTSGSTGAPKGVPVTHGSVVDLLACVQEQPGISRRDRMLGLNAYTFDISVLEIFLPLVSGASLVLVDQGDWEENEKLQQLLRIHLPTIVQGTPAFWEDMLANNWAGDSSLKALCGGERLTESLAAALINRVGSLWNMYGPTETTIWSFVKGIVSGEAPTLGKPLPNSYVLLLNQAHEPVPEGSIGEIAIGGTGLSNGYLNQAELTKEKFIDNPIQPGSILYKTGDLGKLLPNGEIQFMGRQDAQVQIQGIRVEPEEIEKALLKYPEVKQAVVIGGKVLNRPQQLVAYLTRSQGVSTAGRDGGNKEGFLLETQPHGAAQKEALRVEDGSQPPGLTEKEESVSSAPSLKGSVLAILEEHAGKNRDRICLVHEDKVFSFSFVHKQVNQMAGILRKEAIIFPEDPVGVLVPRSEKLLFAVLAVWKCGGAYLPIAETLPAERIFTVLRDSGCKLVIGEDEVIGEEIKIGMEAYAKLFRYGQLDCPQDQPAIDLSFAGPPSPGSAAYVMYTSGSTGVPKGVVVEYAGMMNHLQAKREDLAIRNIDKIAQSASQSFDVHLWQMFGAWLTGGQTVVLDDHAVSDLNAFMHQLRARQVTILEIIPSFLAVLLDYLAESGMTFPASLYAVRLLVITGEVLPYDLARRCKTCFPGVTLINAYGPTEASDDVTHGEVAPSIDNPVISIGKPIRNTRIHIMTSEGKPCAPGEKGDIFVAGTPVGRGYLNQVEKTADSFLPDPFTSQKGKKMYRTGDTGRWLADGSIEFCGRKDHQVKLRGNRIELSEIEYQLTRMRGLREAVVCKVESSGSAYLAAYLTLGPGESVTAGEVLREVARYLPAYMIPDKIIFLEKLPRTLTGKVNRRSLPHPETLRLNQEFVRNLRAFLSEWLPWYMIPENMVCLEEIPVTLHGKTDTKALPPIASLIESDTNLYTPPASIAERKLTRIWEKLFNRGMISTTDNFFYLGGNSLRAITMTSLINKEFKRNVRLSEVFLNPTIAALARLLKDWSDAEPAPVEEQDHYGGWPGQPAGMPMPPLGIRPDGETTPGHGACWQIVLLAEELDPARVERVLLALEMRHEALRTSPFSSSGGHRYRVLPVRSCPVLSWQAFRWSLDGRPDGIASLSLANGSRYYSHLEKLLSPGLGPFGNGDTGLVLYLDPAIADPWSIKVLAEEFLVLYQADGETGENLMPIEVQAKDYLVWKKKMRHEKKGQEVLQYWRQKLPNKPAFHLANLWQRSDLAATFGETPQATTFRTDQEPVMSRASAAEFSPSMHRMTLPQPFLQQIESAAKDANISLFMLLLSGLQLLLRHLTGRKEVISGVLLGTRPFEQLNHTVGKLDNTILLATRVEDSVSILNFMAGLSASFQEDMQQGFFPPEEILEQLNVSSEELSSISLQYMEGTGVAGFPWVRQLILPVAGTTPFFMMNCCIINYQTHTEIVTGYDSRWYRESTVVYFMNTYKDLLLQMAENVNRLVQDVLNGLGQEILLGDGAFLR